MEELTNITQYFAPHN